MLILGIETATHQTSVAIGTPEGVVACYSVRRERRHVESLAPAIDYLCHEMSVEPRSVDVVAVDRGPGLYTGLRVGIATAKAIAYAADVDAIGICSLDVLAFSARLCRRRIVSMIDARRGEIYFCEYRSQGGRVEAVTEPGVAKPEQVLRQLKPIREGYLIVGDGGLRYADLFIRDDLEIADAGFAFPHAVSLVHVARHCSENFGDQRTLEPLYLRPPDVTLSKNGARGIGPARSS